MLLAESDQVNCTCSKSCSNDTATSRAVFQFQEVDLETVAVKLLDEYLGFDSCPST